MTTRSGTITMTMREVDRLRTIQSVVDGMLMTWQAAERLHLSRRQVERLTTRYRSQGASGLLSRHRGHPSNYQLADGVAERDARELSTEEIRRMRPARETLPQRIGEGAAAELLKRRGRGRPTLRVCNECSLRSRRARRFPRDR